MATPHRTPATVARADHLRATRTLFRAVFREAWKALGQYRLPYGDRRRVAHAVVFVALQRWDSYRQDLGSPRRWLQGIVRNEVRSFRRQEGKPGGATAVEIDDLADESRAAEDEMADRDLLERLLAELPHPQRQVIILYHLYGFTLAEIAVLEKTSVTRAHVRRVAGMAALRAAAQRFRREQEARGVVPLPISIAGLFAAHRPPDPPGDVFEATRRSVAAEMGLEGPPDSAPPSSGPRRCDSTPAASEPPRSSGPAPLLRLLGLLGGILGGVILGLALGHSEQSPAHREPTTTMLDARLPALSSPSPSPPPPALLPSQPAAEAPGRAGASDVPTPTSASRVAPVARPTPDKNDQLRIEQAIMDGGHAALEVGNLTAALTACADHARLFPGGQHAVDREQLWTDTCKRLRRALRGSRAPVDDRCTGRP